MRLLSGRRRWVLAAAVVAASGLIWGLWAWRRDRAHREAIARVELEMANGRFNAAAGHLEELLKEEPDSDEAAVLLGRCEKECGRIATAASAFARVPPGSPLSHQATLARMRLAHDRGQFARAEAIIEDAAADPRNDGPHTRFLLVPIYSQLGMLDAARHLIEDRWEHLREDGEGASEPAIDLVRMHVELDLKPNPVEDVRGYIEGAAGMAPDDDRIWLGRANLAIRTGDLAGARRWLDAGRRRRPTDAAVWSACLRLGLAANRLDDVNEALCAPAGRGDAPVAGAPPAGLARRPSGGRRLRAPVARGPGRGRPVRPRGARPARPAVGPVPRRRAPPTSG